MWRKSKAESRQAAKARARAEAIREPKRIWRGFPIASPFSRFVRPRWRRRIFTAVAWLGGWGFLTWALADALGPAGWKIGLGLLLVGSGGILPLWKVVVHGLVEFPPWDWFTEEED